ncbi:MAG: GNAT family N-acetyltransferase [Acidobacteriia bacterium]|nr:GNAT family N-acetyltransferase [Terriglobia bacterium]MBV8903227.1 GNAT family N-acetyltransferase [Terriglobia bacterium]MBV9746874.1 GNAT family N-acetyltransferase [Terriglobia bacterium]
MSIVVQDLGAQSAAVLEAAAVLLVDHFDEPGGWREMTSAREEVGRVLKEGFGLAAMENGFLQGWIGGLPEYNGRVWELHPIVVHRACRLRGVGRALVAAFEEEVNRRGAHTITLGTDDHWGMTSLSGVDLYDDLPGKLTALWDLGRKHPFLFYKKLGYVVTGVLPDANGPGRPDIYMSKRVRKH